MNDLAVTMRGAIAKALGEDTLAASAFLNDIDLGLQAISALTGPGEGASQAPDLASAPTPSPPAGGAVPRADDTGFETYLQLQMKDQTLRLHAVERLSGGFSRDMIRLRCQVEGQVRDIVLRREVPGGLLEGIGLDVEGEYPLMRVARAGGVPVAAPLWLETDASILGHPFIAMDCAPGSCLGTSLGAAGAIGHEQLTALAAMLAALHGVDEHELAQVGGSERDAPAAAVALLDAWQAYWDLTPMTPPPVLTQAMNWLRDHLPVKGAAPCLTHGDVGFHNIMAADGRFTALLDWEMAVIASPAKDLAHVRPSVEHMVDWDVFVGWYEAAGGVRISADEIRWFEVFRAFSMTLVCHVALAKLTDPKAARIEYFRLGFLALPVFSQQLSALLSAEV